MIDILFTILKKLSTLILNLFAFGPEIKNNEIDHNIMHGIHWNITISKHSVKSGFSALIVDEFF